MSISPLLSVCRFLLLRRSSTLTRSWRPWLIRWTQSRWSQRTTPCSDLARSPTSSVPTETDICLRLNRVWSIDLSPLLCLLSPVCRLQQEITSYLFFFFNLNLYTKSLRLRDWNRFGFHPKRHCQNQWEPLNLIYCVCVCVCGRVCKCMSLQWWENIT